MPITKEQYDSYASKSFFVDNNFSGRYAPSNISSNMIPCENLKEFHYQTSFFLHFYSSLYIKLQDHQSSISFNVSKFANTIENMGIKINNILTTYLADFNLSGNRYVFTFYIKKFESISTSNYTTDIFNPISSLSIINKSTPNFGSYANILNIESSYTSNLILKSTGFDLSNTDVLDRGNTLQTLPESSKMIKNVNTSKFKEIIEEIFSQKPENIIGYLLYKKIYYNIILYNIAIQNSLRKIYLNFAKHTNFDIANNLFDDDGGQYSNYILPVRSQITLNTANINELSRSHFVSENNDFLLEKNEYRNKINALNTLKEEYNKIQDKLNISTKLYNQQFKNYKTIKFYATYVIIALIIIIILTISLSIFPIFSVDVKNSIYIISLIVLIVITYLYYTNFKYVNLYEKFSTTYYYINFNTIATIDNTAGPNGSNSGYIVGKEYTVTITGNTLSGSYDIKAVAGNFVLGYYKIQSGGGGSNYELGDKLEFNGNNTQATGEVISVISQTKAIDVIRIKSVGSSNFDAPPIMIIKRGTGSSEQIINNGANFPLNFGKITSIKVYANTVLYSEQPTTITIANPDYDYVTINTTGETSTTKAIPTTILSAEKSTRKASIAVSIATLFSTTTDIEIYRINQQGGYSFNSAQVAILNIDKNIIPSCPSSNILIIDFLATNANSRTNHAKFYTQLLPQINQYNNAYNDLMNNIRMNMYTIGSKTFSQDANIYLYNLYLEKKRQNENNKIKYTNLFNMIEIIKKQINFLFNIVFILGCFCIILLLGLVLYSTTPELYIFIIILCVVLISILMIYFGFAIIQPTRMIVNKNYWAIVNPSKTAISKL